MADIFCTNVSISRMVGRSGPNQFKMPDVGIVFSIAFSVGGPMPSELSLNALRKALNERPFTAFPTPSAMPLVDVDFLARRRPSLMEADVSSSASLSFLVVLGREYLGMYLDMLGWGSFIGLLPSGAHAARCRELK